MSVLFLDASGSFPDEFVLTRPLSAPYTTAKGGFLRS